MKPAIRSLYRQFRTEAQFGWYVPNRNWRERLRALYPVQWVSAHHRQDFPPSLLNEHARRVMSFNAGMRA